MFAAWSATTAPNPKKTPQNQLTPLIIDQKNLKSKVQNVAIFCLRHGWSSPFFGVHRLTPRGGHAAAAAPQVLLAPGLAGRQGHRRQASKNATQRMTFWIRCIFSSNRMRKMMRCFVSVLFHLFLVPKSKRLVEGEGAFLSSTGAA